MPRKHPSISAPPRVPPTTPFRRRRHPRLHRLPRPPRQTACISGQGLGVQAPRRSGLVHHVALHFARCWRHPTTPRLTALPTARASTLRPTAPARPWEMAVKAVVFLYPELDNTSRFASSMASRAHPCPRCRPAPRLHPRSLSIKATVCKSTAAHSATPCPCSNPARVKHAATTPTSLTVSRIRSRSSRLDALARAAASGSACVTL